MTFCKNCGTKLNPQDEFCPNCGTKNETPQQPQQPDGMGADAVTAVPGGKKPFLGMNTKGLLIAAGCIVVTAVLVIVLLCSFFGSSSKSVVKDYYKAIENCDAKDLMATVPKDYLKELMDDNDLSRKELTNDVQDYLDKYYDEYDDIKVTFEDKEYTDTKTEPVPAKGHQLTAVEAVPATCETAGVKAHWVCSVCGKLFSDAGGKTETTMEKLAIPATGHAYGTPVWKWNDDFTASATFTCGNDASHVETVNAAVTNEVTTEATCEADGVRTYTAKVTFEGEEYTDTKTEVIPATGHDTELVGAKDATCTEDGYTGDEVCKVCGVTVKQGEVIPALGHDYKDGKCSRCGAEEPTTPVEPGKPTTGDSSTLVLWLALLAISGMAVTVIPSRKKRSR